MVGFTSWKAVGIVAGVSVVFVLLTLGVFGWFSRVPAAELAAVQAENADIRVKNRQLVDMATFYQNQVKAYRKKFPKSASSFPFYVLPATASVTK